MILVSYVVVVVNPISACMIAALILLYRKPLNIGLAARFFAALLCVALLGQAVEHIELLKSYREPRARLWIVAMLAQHGVIWSLFLKTLLHPATPGPKLGLARRKLP